MRLKITHEVTTHFSNPANGSIQTVRMEPRGLNGQYVNGWRLDVSADCLLKPVIDPYGNLTYTFSVPGPLTSLTIVGVGTVTTEDTVGVVRGTSERMPLPLFLRDTERTKASPRIRDFAETIAATDGPGTLAILHGLMHRIHDKWKLEPSPNDLPVVADAVMEHHEASAEGLAHLFIAATRALDIPARYVSGYRFDDEKADPTTSVAAWVEAWVDGIGWIGFDPARNVCPSEPYVRLACGLDCYDALPLRIAPYGAEVTETETSITVEHLPDV